MRRILAYLAIALVLGACAIGEVLENDGDPVDMHPVDLVGTWYSPTDSGSARLMTFRNNGVFSATNLPYAAFEEDVRRDFDPGVDRLDGSGSWSLVRPPGQSAGPTSEIELDFQKLDGVTVASAGPNLSALRQSNGKVLLFFFYVGQGGNSWTSYERCDTTCR
jgi:hypothetical protein